MDTAFALQSMWPWFAIAGALLVVFRAISGTHLEVVPRWVDTLALTLGIGMLVLAALSGVAPYLIVFFGARPV